LAVASATLVVDLDGILTPTDTLVESVIQLTAKFWTYVPETFALGALTIAIAVVFHGSKQPYSPAHWILANLISLSMTVTNFSVSVISMFLLLTRRQMVLATALALLQKAAFPQPGLFFLGLEQEVGYVQLTRRSAPEVLLKVLDRGVVFLSAGVMLPGIHTSEVVRVSGLPQACVRVGAYFLAGAVPAAFALRRRDVSDAVALLRAASVSGGPCPRRFRLKR
jgi:hypothetical protein